MFNAALFKSAWWLVTQRTVTATNTKNPSQTTDLFSELQSSVATTWTKWETCLANCKPECLVTDWTTGIPSLTKAEDSPSSLCVQTGSGAHPASCTVGNGVLSLKVKCGRGVMLTTDPHLVPSLSNSRSYTSPPPEHQPWRVARNTLPYPTLKKYLPVGLPLNFGLRKFLEIPFAPSSPASVASLSLRLRVCNLARPHFNWRWCTQARTDGRLGGRGGSRLNSV
jgi:hypothetical protein